MNGFSQSQLAVLDRRVVAVHESAHAVIASLWTDSVGIRLFPNQAGISGEKTVLGSVSLGEFDCRRGLCAIGWAGVLGEIRHSCPGMSFEDSVELVKLGFVLSLTDKIFIEQVEPAERRLMARVAFKALSENWADVMSIADLLITIRAARHISHGTQVTASHAVAAP